MKQMAVYLGYFCLFAAAVPLAHATDTSNGFITVDLGIMEPFSFFGEGGRGSNGDSQSEPEFVITEVSHTSAGATRGSEFVEVAAINGVDMDADPAAITNASGGKKYLGTKFVPRVEYVASSNIESAEIPTASLSEAPKFSDFLAKLSMNSTEGEFAGSRTGERGSNQSEVADASKASIQEKQGEAESPSDYTDQPSSTIKASGEISSNYMAQAGQGRDYLFRRPGGQRSSESQMLLFFPVGEASNLGDGNYSVLTPVDPFNYFAPPNALVPRSSATYRTGP